MNISGGRDGWSADTSWSSLGGPVWVIRDHRRRVVDVLRDDPRLSVTDVCCHMATLAGDALFGDDNTDAAV